MKNAPPSVFFESPARRFRAVVLLNPFLQAIPVYTILPPASSFGIDARSVEEAAARVPQGRFGSVPLRLGSAQDTRNVPSSTQTRWGMRMDVRLELALSRDRVFPRIARHSSLRLVD
jgi:hypothetical protein